MNIEDKIKNIGKISISDKENQDLFKDSKLIDELKPKDFDSIKTYKLKDKTVTLIYFYAPWCGYCQRSKDLIEQVADKITFVNIKSFNCEKNKSHANKMNIDLNKDSNQSLVKGYPTIWLYKNQLPYKKFEQERTLENLIKFCMDNCKK